MLPKQVIFNVIFMLKIGKKLLTDIFVYLFPLDKFPGKELWVNEYTHSDFLIQTDELSSSKVQ